MQRGATLPLPCRWPSTKGCSNTCGQPHWTTKMGMTLRSMFLVRTCSGLRSTDFRIAIGIWKVRARGVSLPPLLLCRCVPVVSLCPLCCFWCCVPVVLSLLSLLVLVLLLLMLLYRLLLLLSLLLVLTLLLLLLPLLLSLLM